MEAQIRIQVELLAAALLQRQQCVAVAESCTGGGLAWACTALAGSSAWFERAYVTYANAAKSEMLGVPQQLIHAHGAVSAEVALAMAVGVLQHAPVHWAVSITGVAGPAGGTPEKPVGTVWLGWAGRQDVGLQDPSLFIKGHQGLQLSGDRAQIRSQSIHAALQRLNLVIKGKSG